jgi:hypothetical protein
MSLVWFVASASESHFTEAGAECCRMRVGIEQWPKEVDGSFNKLDPTFHDMVAFESTGAEKRSWASRPPCPRECHLDRITHGRVMTSANSQGRERVELGSNRRCRRSGATAVCGDRRL